MKWITAADLENWPDRDSQATLPELVYKLICASAKDIAKARFPKGDSVYLPGFDGVLECDEKIFRAIEGVSLWEIGTDKKVKAKADGDYKKRKANNLGYTPSESTYIFVTSRRWGGAEKWCKDKQAEGYWKRVIVLTAIELENWLEERPSVAIWLAERLGKTTVDRCFSSVDSWWMRWAKGEDITLNHNILLGGRASEIEALEEAIKSYRSRIVQSVSSEESLAFIVATILEKGVGFAERCIVVQGEEALNKIIDNYENLIIATDVPNRNYAYASSKGHVILYAASAEETFQNSSDVVKLPQIDRDEFIASLKISGLSEEYAGELSKETARSISILRRKLEIDRNMPKWAASDNIRELIPAILIGRWDENRDGDCEIVSLVSGQSYDEYSTILTKWLIANDSPLINVDGKWRVKSMYEAYSYALNHLSQNDFKLYSQAMQLISNDIAPDALDRWQAKSLYFGSEQRKYSSMVKDGVFQSAILISMLIEKSPARGFASGKDWIDSQIDAILDTSTIEWWLSYEDQVTLIAEAAPKIFINYISKNVKQQDSLIGKLFFVDGDLTDSKVGYTHILWALESLMWDQNMLLPVSLILMDLAAITNNSNMANKPANTLLETYKLWHPQTFADVNWRNITLAKIVKADTTIGFDLCLKLIKSLDGVAFHNQKMRWRYLGQNRKNSIPYSEIFSSIDNVVDLMIDICDGEESKICEMVDISSKLSKSNRAKIFTYIDSIFEQLKNSVVLSDTLRSEIYSHKSFSEAKWALPGEELARYEELLAKIELVGYDKYLWMFDNSKLKVYYPDLSIGQHSEIMERNRELQKKALEEIYSEGGLKNVFEFSNLAESPSTVGEVFAQICDGGDFDAVVKAVAKEEVPMRFAESFFYMLHHKWGSTSFVDCVANLAKSHPDVIHIPLTSAFLNSDILSYINTLPQPIKDQYWSNIHALNCCSDPAVSSHVIDQFNAIGRYRDYIL